MDDTVQMTVQHWNRRIDQLDGITHNLANAGSLGYKSFRLHFNKAATDASYKPVVKTDFTPGAIQHTGNPLDVAIEGDGFFAVQTPFGVAYTRRGSFGIAKNGDLVNESGEAVLGRSGGKINISGGRVEITGEGAVIVDGQKVDSLKVVTFADKGKLVRIPGCKFQDRGEAGLAEATGAQIHAEHLEASNVNVVSEMSELINIQRLIEYYQKNMQTIAELDKLSSNRIGRLYS